MLTLQPSGIYKVLGLRNLNELRRPVIMTQFTSDLISK